MTHSNGNGNGTAATTRTMTKRDLPRQPAPPPPRSGLGWLWFLILGLLVAGGLLFAVLFGFAQRSQHETSVAANTEQMAVPTVLTVAPKVADPHVHLTLPGTVSALIESSVYAQVGGYVKDWKFDIGAKVHANDLLAEIDTPVTDQQLRQAQEGVNQAQANLNLARATAARYNDLLASNAVSREDVDTQNAQLKVQEANLSAAQAYVAGIEKTEGFKEVRAPFDGVVTARRVDVGDYIRAAGQSASGTTTGVGNGSPGDELFAIAQTHTLRVYVNVPEQYADEIKPGIKAAVVLASAPGRSIEGTLVRTADAIDPASLTLLCEVDIDNADGSLLPGGYAHVNFDIVSAHPPLVVPGNCLIFREAGPQVGVVGDDGIVHLNKIVIGRDLGTSLEITSGVQPDDRVIVNPSDSLADGQKVRVMTPPPTNP
jgi:multidrug efflux pump subunit AcrA (membrane-fusion protein)